MRDGEGRRHKRVAAALVSAGVIVLSLAQPAPVHAAANIGLAVPGSFATGYATDTIVVAKDAPFLFVSVDIQAHDIVSVEPGPERGRYLFASEIIQAAGAVEVRGMERTEPGVTYELYCSLHPITMRGTVEVVGVTG